MAIIGGSFTARAFSLNNREVELPRTRNRMIDIKAEIQAVRELLEAGATDVEVIHWNNWIDGYGSTRYQSCSLTRYYRKDNGRLTRKPINIH